MSEFRVIYHQRACPDCGSDDVTEQEIEITDGSSETALSCQACGAAWPLACIAEQLEPARTNPCAQPHLVLRTDGCPPDAMASQRQYWCPACGTYLTGIDLTRAWPMHYTPGPERVITKADLSPAEVRP